MHWSMFCKLISIPFSLKKKKMVEWSNEKEVAADGNNSSKRPASFSFVTSNLNKRFPRQ